MSRTNGPLAIIAVAFATGIYLNALGWLGNAVLLQEEWNKAYEALGATQSPPYSPIIREIVTLLSDFVYAFALVWIFAGTGPRHAAPVRYALELILVLWLATVAMTYLALVNSGFLPHEIAVKSSLWALLTFLPLTFFLPAVFRLRTDRAVP